MRALLYVTVRRLVNALRNIPKNPRLLLPVVFFLLAFAAPVFQFLLIHADHRPALPPAAFTPREFVSGDPGVLVAGVRTLLLLSLFASAAAAFGEGNLFFAQSDVDFLFPAPLSRRLVLLFKMAGTYASLIFPTVYFPFLIGGPLAARAGTTPLAYWPGMVGVWLFLLASTNVTQTVLLNRPEDENDSPRARVQKALRVLGYALLVAGGIVAYQFLEGEGMRGIRGVLRVINSEGASLLLLPIAWASDLFLIAFQGWSLAGAAKLAGLFVLAAGSFALLFSRERDFYGGAIEVSARRQRMVAAVQSGDAGTILSQMASEGKLVPGRTLRPLGSGALAIVWKDLISTTRTPLRSWVMLLVIASFPALFGRAFGGRNGDAGVLLWAFVFTLNISNIFLLSLRDMLRRADIMKALPIPPARLLLAELAFGILNLTLLGWVSLGLMVLLGMGRGPLTLVAFIALPSLAALLLFVQTCFVLLYPNRNDQAQNTVGGLLGVMASTLSLMPTIAVGLALFFARVGPLLMGLGVAATNLVAAVAALSFAAFLWQRFDPTD